MLFQLIGLTGWNQSFGAGTQKGWDRDQVFTPHLGFTEQVNTFILKAELIAESGLVWKCLFAFTSSGFRPERAQDCDPYFLGNSTALDKIFSLCTFYVTVLLGEKKKKETKLFEIKYCNCKDSMCWKLLIHARITTLQGLCILVMLCFWIRMLKSNKISGTISSSSYRQSLVPVLRGQFYYIPSKPFLW